MALFRQKRSKFYWYDFRIDGVRHRGSTKQTSITQARNIESALIHQLGTGQITSANRRPCYLSELAPRFLEFVKSSRLDDDSKSYYQNGWRMLKDQDIAKMRIDQISTSAASCVKTTGSGSNVNCALRTLRRMLNLAVEWKLLLSCPRIHLVKEIERERVIRPDEELLYLAKANPTMRDVFMMMMDMGPRPSEAVSVAWPNVDFVEGRILVVAGKTAKARRYLIMTARIREMLLTRLRSQQAAGIVTQWAFPSPRRKGEHIKPRSVVVMGSAIKRELGFAADLVLYSARHTFGTDFQSGHGDIVKTSKALGHASINITQRYLHPDTANQAKIMDARNAERHTSGHTAYPVQ